MATGSALSDSWSNQVLLSLYFGPDEITFNAFLGDFTPTVVVIGCHWS